jgi:hypothetical protein
MDFLNDKAEKRMLGLEEKESTQKNIADKILNVDEIMRTEFPEAEWLIDKLIPLQGITIISGAPATYKTWLLMQMAINITENTPFLGKFQCTKSGILVIDEENQLRLIQKRIGFLDYRAGRQIYYLSQEDFSALDLKSIKEVIEFCDNNSIDTIFIDSLVRISNVDENGAQQMAQVFKGLKKFCKAGKTVIITHHERKEGANPSTASSRLRGSSDILAAVDCHLAITRNKDDRNELIIEQSKLRTDEEMEPFTVVVIKEADKTRFEHAGVLIDKKIEETKDLIFGILEENKDGLSMTGIYEKVKESVQISRKSVNAILGNLIKDGEINSRKGARNTTLCFIDNPEAGEQSQLSI